MLTKANSSILIPARMESSRFPGKPLAPINGIPLVIYCAKNALNTGYNTLVCTDSEEILSVCKFHNVDAIKTPPCNTGTDRIAWSADTLNSEYLINLQGDEPLLTADVLHDFIDKCNQFNTFNDCIYTGVSRVSSQSAFDPNNVKCVLNENGEVLYMSRKPLLSSSDPDKPYFKQTGLYAMSKSTLLDFSRCKQSQLEILEKIELLRWIEGGNIVYGCEQNITSISVDTPLDFIQVLDFLKVEHGEQ